MASSALLGCVRHAAAAGRQPNEKIVGGLAATCARMARPAALLHVGGKSSSLSGTAVAPLHRTGPPQSLMANAPRTESALTRRGGWVLPWWMQKGGSCRTQVTTAAADTTDVERERVPRAPPPPKESFCVVKIGGKQHKVSKDDSISVEKLALAKVGDKVTFDEVLLVGNKDGKTWIGTPIVQGAYVEAIVEQQTLGPKVYIFKKRRRKNSKRMRGFRAQVTSIRISDVKAPSD